MLPNRAASGAPASILLVEDEVVLRALMAEELRAAGFRVVETADAESALDILASDTPIDVVFSDVRLRGKLTGLDLAAQVESLRPDLPVIVTSATANAAAAKGFHFVPKPYDLGAVTDLLRSLAPPAERSPLP